MIVPYIGRGFIDHGSTLGHATTSSAFTATCSGMLWAFPWPSPRTSPRTPELSLSVSDNGQTGFRVWGLGV